MRWSRKWDRAEREFELGHFRAAGEIWAGLKEHPDALFNAANSFREAGDLERAESLFGTAIERGVSDAYLNLAFLLEGQGRLDEVDRLLEQGASAGDPGASVELAFRLKDLEPERARGLASAHLDDVLRGKDAQRLLALLPEQDPTGLDRP